MEALYDRSGKVYAWLDDRGRIISLGGKHLAFIDGDSVYSWQGRHIGWWRDGHIRDSAGAVALFTDDATNMGLIKPVKSVKPVKPMREVAPLKPLKPVKPVKPIRQLAWSRKIPF